MTAYDRVRGVTSLFSRLQKLNKEATPGPWHVVGPPWNTSDAPYIATAEDPHGATFIADSVDPAEEGSPEAGLSEENFALIVECRNSLPAVLNLIEAARPLTEWNALPDYEYTPEACADLMHQLDVLAEAVAVFVTPEGDRSTMSGQEAS